MPHANADTFSLTAYVNRARTPEEAVESTLRQIIHKGDIIRTMPRGLDGEIELVFFKLRAGLDGSRVTQEYESRSLRPDPYALLAVCEADPDIANRLCPVVQW